ncbi:hypothetical protein M2271_002149 [Streptomyces sp. LBL]|uniref:hypothetical protein n=1 Tax=Streptomyces sp. LBL TaxID=2940562 RepID=UPI002476DD5E|nr:hypothetical protein [Streptomyces sp. LBL]MDH6624347.1 hypothetical protein [Streptomyces sp. LBL]
MDTPKVHAFRLIRAQPGQAPEVFDDDVEIDVALFRDDASSLTAGCLCGWVNPHPGPRFPRDLPERSGREAPEKQHCRWYHTVAWAHHAGPAEGDPGLLDTFRDPGMTVNDICLALIFGLRLLLDRVQEQPSRTRAVYTSVESVMRSERVRRNRTSREEITRRPVSMPKDAPEWACIPEDITAGMRVLLETTGTQKGGYWDCLAIEMAAGQLSHLAVEDNATMAA